MSIRVIVGPMYSGKTSKLLDIGTRLELGGIKCYWVRHSIDKVKETHVGTKKRGEPYALLTELNEVLPRLSNGESGEKAHVLIDETQFFGDALSEILEMQDKGYSVIAAGLDMNYLREPFGPMAQLMAVASEVVKQKAVCCRCGDTQAGYTFRVNGGRVIRVGVDGYLPVCLKCWNFFDSCLEKPYYGSLQSRVIKSMDELDEVVDVESPFDRYMEKMEANRAVVKRNHNSF